MKRTLITLLILAALVLAGCGSAEEETAEGTMVAAEAVFTAAAQTAEARLAQRFAQATTPAAQQATTTQAATPTPSITPTLTQPTPAGTASAPPTTGDRAEFVADVTIPDGTNMTPNQAFTKTWRVINNGTTTWDSRYALVFSSGTSMSAPAVVNLPASVPPGQTADITVNLVAPANPGEYIGYFILKNPGGQIFGVGPNAVDAIWVQIVVAAGTAVPTATSGTPVAGSTTPTVTTQAGTVSQVTLNVDNSAATGCPHTFTYTAQFTLSQPATVTYQLEAAVTPSNITITPPSASTIALQAGTHSVVYTLNFSASLNGIAVFHITTPADVKSNQVSFTLNCQ